MSCTALPVLLLKTLFNHAEHHRHDAIYVTVLERHATVVDLLTASGFETTDEARSANWS